MTSHAARLRILVFLALLISSGAQAQGTQSANARLPAAIDSFALVESHLLDQPGAGTAYRYQAGLDWSVDVFLFPVPDSGSDETVLAAEAQRFVQTLRLQQQQGRFDRYAIARAAPTPLIGTDSIAGFMVAAALQRGKETFLTQFYLYVRSGEFLKIRFTVPTSKYRGRGVEPFAQALADSLWHRR